MTLACQAGIIERMSEDISMGKHNPFTPGFGVEPPYLAGRETEQNILTKVLHRTKDLGKGQSIVMYGPRGTGKTVLLSWFEAECDKAEVVAIKATPSGKIRSMNALPELLLHENKLRPDKLVAGIGSVKAEWDMKRPESMGMLESSLIEECRSTPRVLLLDEAHTLKPKICQSLLTLTQEVAGKAPFLLIMAGTPGLRPFLMSVGATFVERGQKLGIGRLDEQGAAEAISKPLQQDGISIEKDALSRVVADAQCYPYFLQLWGSALWDAAAERDASRLTDADVERAMPEIAVAKEDFYKDRYDSLDTDKPLLAAAYAVACAFRGEHRLARGEIPKIIEKSLPDTLTDKASREDEAERLSQELILIDFVWEPGSAREVEPGIPSFMTYVQSEVKKSRKQRDDHSPEKEQFKRSDRDMDWEREP